MFKRMNRQILISILLLIFSIWALQYDPPESTRSELVAVGSAETESNNLSRKSLGDLIWSKLSSHDKIYQGDHIYTGEKCLATLDVFDTIQINLDEFTLIKIGSEKGLPDLEVGQGTFDIELKDKAKEVTLKVGKVRFKISGSNANIGFARHKGNVVLAVKKGSVEINRINPESSEVIEKNTVSSGSIAILSEAKSEQKQNCVQYISPIKKETVVQHDQDRMSFRWKNLCAEAGDTLEIASNPRFTDILFTSKVSGEAESAILPKDLEGQLYWRVKHGENFAPAETFSRRVDNTKTISNPVATPAPTPTPKPTPVPKPVAKTKPTPKPTPKPLPTPKPTATPIPTPIATPTPAPKAVATPMKPAPKAAPKPVKKKKNVNSEDIDWLHGG